ncbi:hypothetical protein PYW07_004752 [Mythimna separata]|uniref:C2H2-type domain-containing protein n=1 Tax=Mythimna separata TaxID=271217 RepID=A0AAD7YZR8_MYTSE|nr:hypothetical protein PYW07_004752 [Mythimna separata]
MPNCNIIGCGIKRSRNRPNITLHQLPTNKEKKKIWLEAIESCFNRTLNKVTLRDDALPTRTLLPAVQSNMFGILLENDTNVTNSQSLSGCGAPNKVEAVGVPTIRNQPGEILKRSGIDLASSTTPMLDLVTSTSAAPYLAVRASDVPDSGASTSAAPDLAASTSFAPGFAANTSTTTSATADLSIHTSKNRKQVSFKKLVDLRAMETEDNMVFLVVVDDDKKGKSSKRKIPTVEPSKTNIEVDSILETVQKHGEFILLEPKQEIDDDQQDYLEDGNASETGSEYQPSIKEEIKEEELDISEEELKEAKETDNNEGEIQEEEEEETDNSEGENSSEGESSSSQQNNKRRFTMLKPWQRYSFVEELRKKHKELRKDKELLINTLGGIMKTVKPPPPPPNFYRMNGPKYQCVYCGFLKATLPGASRHYQEKHGERYLVCYACGVDFTSTGNLYKHEKRCIAPDAEIVLRARGVFLGRKGRGRPFLTANKFALKDDDKTFQCSMCSAVLVCKTTLESHENLHRGKRPFRCHACPAAYTSSSALTRHTKIHKDIQYLCDHCGRSFKVKGALISHMATHNPIKKYKCDECDRRFAQKQALMLHVNRVHRNLPPPCACQICPKRYPRMYLLKAHMKREHGMSIITRRMFFKTLPTMSEQEIDQCSHVTKEMKS